MSKDSIQPRPSALRDDLFRELALQAQVLGAKDNLDFTPFYDPGLIHFSALDEAGKANAIWMLEILVQIANELQPNGISLRHTKKVIWSFLRIVHMTQPSDLLDQFEDDDFIEIYSEHHQLIFANPQFLDALSYSLEDLYCRPWMTLFGYPQETFAQLSGLVGEVIGGKHHTWVDMSFISTYPSREVDSPKHLHGMTTPRIMSPLFRHGKPVAYLCVNKHRPIT